MPKYYKKKYYYPGSRDKYSIEQQAGDIEVPANGQAYATVVPDTGVQGMRKVKHLTISLAGFETASGGSHIVYWALVYVPQGVPVNTLSLSGTTGMYEPNQHVMNCGVMDFSAGPTRVTSPVSRNLNSGDKVVLILANVSSVALHWNYVVRYAVTLQ